MDPGTAAALAAYRARGVGGAAVAFARDVVSASTPAGPARARSLLWVCSRLAAWGMEMGLDPVGEVLLHPSVIERFVVCAMASSSPAARRTARTNLRFVSTRAAPGLGQPRPPAALARGRAKAPYGPEQVAAYFALAAAQPTQSRRRRLVALLCLGLGAGLERGELRAVTGRHVRAAAGGGVVVAVEGRRARSVPVLARYGTRLLDAAADAGDGFVCGGISPARKNLTANLVASVAGGADLGRLDVGRLRATWLCEHLGRLGLVELLAAAGITCSQRLGDLAAHLAVPDDAALMEVLGR